MRITMTASELDYNDAKCETCKHRVEHNAGITFQVCEEFTYGSGLGEQVFKVEDDFVCGRWEENEDV